LPHGRTLTLGTGQAPWARSGSGSGSGPGRREHAGPGLGLQGYLAGQTHQRDVQVFQRRASEA